MHNYTRTQVKLDTNIRHNGRKLVSDAASEVLNKKQIDLEMSVTDTDEANPTNKPVMVLLHMNSASSKVWHSVVDNLKNNYRIITIDLLGHGDSTKICDLQNLNAEEKELLSAQFYNPVAMVKEIEQVFDTKKLHDTYVAGWYLGGNLAYAIADDKPNYIAKLITIGAPPVRFTQKGLTDGFSDWFTQTLVPEWIAKPARFSETQAHEIAKNLHFENDQTFLEDLNATDPAVRKHLFANSDTYDKPEYDVLDARKWVLNTTIPVSLMVSEKEAGADPEYIKSFKGHLKNQNSEVKVLKDEGRTFFNSTGSCAAHLHRFFSGTRKDEAVDNEKTTQVKKNEGFRRT